MVFRDRPVRRAIARIDSCSRKCQRRITLNNAMSNTPAAPAQKAEASVRTWVNSQWQLHPKPGQLSAAINSVSHNPREHTSAAELEAGVRVLLDVVRKLEIGDVIRRATVKAAAPAPAGRQSPPR